LLRALLLLALVLVAVPAVALPSASACAFPCCTLQVGPVCLPACLHKPCPPAPADSAPIQACTPPTGSVQTVAAACVDYYAINHVCVDARTFEGEVAHCVWFVGPPL